MFKLFLLFFLSLGTLLASIDINKATKVEFMQISGIGAKKADAIIAYRKQHGNFKSINDLQNVSGIGTSIVKNVKEDKRNSRKKTTPKTVKYKDNPKK